MAFLGDISKPHDLKKTETADKSGPVLDSSVHVGKSNHGELLAEVQGDHKLKHVETADRSAPQIASDAHVKSNNRGALLADIASKAPKS